MSSSASHVPYFSLGRRPGQIPELDGLRGIAIVLVFLRHAAAPVYERHGHILNIGGWDIRIPLMNGWMGVDLFFVLSGFLITHHLLKRWPDQWTIGFAGRYWSKRILRTFPAYYATVLIALLGIVPAFTPEVRHSGVSLFVHFFFLQDYFGSDLVVAFWSLGVEEKFYLLCPFVLLLLRRRPEPARLLALACLAVLPAVLRVTLTLESVTDTTTYPEFFWLVRSPFHLAMDGLWIGVICALIFNSRDFGLRSRDGMAQWLFYLSSLSLLACMTASAWFDDRHFLASAFVLNGIAIAFGGLLLSVCIGRTPISALLQSRWLRVLSVLSYSIYLTHLMLEPLSLALTDRFFAGATPSALAYLLAFLPVFAGFSLLAGAILHFTAEKPFLILKDRIRV
jgi:peptidoglycan/LPS O-acetylase OafA/YrhL